MNLYLVGYRGSGKSTVAPLIAQALGREVMDSDDLIEANAGVSIAEIFAVQGEAEFRRLETDVVLEISQLSGKVISLGGGAPLAESNRKLIAASGKTVWLFAEPSILWARITGDPVSDLQRPNLTDSGGLAEIEQLLTRRTPVYEACADYKLDVGSLSAEETSERIVQWLQSDDKE